MPEMPQFDAGNVTTFVYQLGGILATLKLALWILGKETKRSEKLEVQRSETTDKLYTIIKEQSDAIRIKSESNSKLNETMHSMMLAELQDCREGRKNLENKFDMLQNDFRNEIQRHR